jgi:hypothetical protein
MLRLSLVNALLYMRKSASIQGATPLMHVSSSSYVKPRGMYMRHDIRWLLTDHYGVTTWRIDTSFPLPIWKAIAVSC